MRRIGLLGSVIAIALSAIACSSSSSSGGGNTDVTADQACTDGVNAICERFNACSPTLVDYVYGDVATCKTRAALNCKASFTASGTSSTPSKIETCAQAIPSLACGDILGRSGISGSPACAVTAGTLDDGKACGDDAQCKSTFCGISNGGCGTCAPLPKAGDACTGACGRGLDCAQGKCVKPGAAGDNCDDKTPCDSNLSCVGGKCTANAKAGAACDISLKTAPNCDTSSGVGCKVDPTKGSVGVCQKIIEAKPGDACSYLDLKLCVGGGTCSDPIKGGTCIAPAKDGEACDDTKGPGCLAPASCTDGKCKISDPSTCK